MQTPHERLLEMLTRLKLTANPDQLDRLLAQAARQDLARALREGLCGAGHSEWVEYLSNLSNPLKTLERVKGIEPSYSAWEAA